MTDHIISRDTVRARARAAFEAGRRRDEHHMNWHSAALPTWLAEWDKCAAKASPASHGAAGQGKRAERAQAA